MSKKDNDIPKEDLIYELIELSENYCDGETPTIRENKEHGKYSRTPYENRFGSWNEALEKCGFGLNRKTVSDKEYIQEIRRVSEELCKGRAPTFTEFEEKSNYTAYNSYRKFDGWRDALLKAGFSRKDIDGRRKEELKNKLIEIENDKNRLPRIEDVQNKTDASVGSYQRIWGSWNKALKSICGDVNARQCISKEDIRSDFESVIEKIGKVPTGKEYNQHSKYHSSTVINKYGSWTKGVKAMGYEPVFRASGEEHPYWKENSEKKYYGPGWYKKRKEIRERDGYECRVCGSRDQRRQLDVHHIKPQTKFIQEGLDPLIDSEIINADDNLVTLCQSCHRKFEDRWQEADTEEFTKKARELYYDGQE